MRNYLFPAILFLTLLTISCDSGGIKEGSPSKEFELIKGEAQGTTYSIKYLGKNVIAKSAIDSILRGVDLSLSVWVDESTISEFNRSESLTISDPMFLKVFFRAKEISELTDYAFHPMIMPLVRAWGFGPEGGQLKSDTNLDSLKAFVNFDFDVRPDPEKGSVFFNKDSGYLLDVNGIAQGYSVDLISEYLESEGILDYMVELGGEVRAKGKNEKDEYWRIGVDKPVNGLEERQLEAIVRLENASLATSGSYRKFYERDGKKYSHTIDPSSGYPVDHGLLSATVMARNCTDADALATAFMVMGVEKTQEFLINHPELDVSVYLIYDDDGDLKTFVGEKMKSVLEEL